jgi:hypothetical protein
MAVGESQEHLLFARVQLGAVALQEAPEFVCADVARVPRVKLREKQRAVGSAGHHPLSALMQNPCSAPALPSAHRGQVVSGIFPRHLFRITQPNHVEKRKGTGAERLKHLFYTLIPDGGQESRNKGLQTEGGKELLGTGEMAVRKRCLRRPSW